ncbi:MAG: permease [Peptococcaceae bacterium BICA1-8]|nr:MAG: permease [Peptococcaceae bacterium BICA1-8]
MNLNNLETTFYFFIYIAGELALLFIVISFLIGILQEYIPPDKIQKVLGGHRHPIISNIFGTIFGAMTPFCSCSTIPITVGLLNGGAPFGATMSFLIASPLLNPVIIALLLSLLGFKITITYFSIVFLASVITGLVWQKMNLQKEIKEGIIQSTSCCDCSTVGVAEITTNKQKITKAFNGAWTLFMQMVPWLLVGAAIGAAIHSYIPEELVVKVAGPDNPLSVPIAAVVGIPMYIRASTMLPISKVLLAKGMTIGTVMALIIGGSGASLPEISLLNAIFKKKLLIIFVLTIFFWATFAGILFNILI